MSGKRKSVYLLRIRNGQLILDNFPTLEDVMLLKPKRKVVRRKQPTRRKKK